MSRVQSEACKAVLVQLREVGKQMAREYSKLERQNRKLQRTIDEAYAISKARVKKKFLVTRKEYGWIRKYEGRVRRKPVQKDPQP